MTPAELPTKDRRKVIKLYAEAFQEKETPCPTCEWHCCAGCAPSEGYHYAGRANDHNVKSTVDRLKETYGWTDLPKSFRTLDWKTFDVEVRKISQGFYVKGQGCRLPVEERSALCLSFTCGFMTPEQQDKGQELKKLLDSCKFKHQEFTTG